MRNKDDICIKNFQLASTMFLSNEDFGIIVRKAMLENDKKNTRYNDLSEYIKPMLEEKENEWNKEFEELTTRDVTAKMAFNSIMVQVNKSNTAFERVAKAKERKKQEKEQEELENQNGQEIENINEPETDESDYRIEVKEGVKNVIFSKQARLEIKKARIGKYEIEDYILENMNRYDPLFAKPDIKKVLEEYKIVYGKETNKKDDLPF